MENAQFLKPMEPVDFLLPLKRTKIEPKLDNCGQSLSQEAFATGQNKFSEISEPSLGHGRNSGKTQNAGDTQAASFDPRLIKLLAEASHLSCQLQTKAALKKR